MMLGHLMLAGQPPARMAQLEAAVPRGCDLPLIRRFAGVEIMRRLIGVAQLPLAASLEKKQRLLERSHAMVLS